CSSDLILAVADKSEATGRRDVARDAAHAAARAPKSEVQRQVCHVNQALFGLFRERRGRAVARIEMFSATAARMSAFNAFSSILSPHESRWRASHCLRGWS